MVKAASTPRSRADFWLLHIELQDCVPSVWRRFVVPSDIDLEKLHEVLQGVMGWDNEHLHSFRMGDKVYGPPDESLEDDPWRSPAEPESLYTLSEALGRKKSFVYLYDFGDDWYHKVTVEKRGLSSSTFPQAAYCLEGANACPPEDIGGVPGYEFMLEALADPAHPEHTEIKEAFGNEFDPALFDLEETNDWLKQFDPLDAREVYQVLKELALGQRTLCKIDEQLDNETGDEPLLVTVDDWLLALSFDEQGLALCQFCRAPDGRLGSMQDWHRAGTDPVAFLSAWELQQVEGLLQAL
ncbi:MULTISPECIES: plasmid pRiA4b ORF-3 family protein [Pseudomonas]|uniref:plasmid pRiA4b ORF-3 family protein n=1 Tax=Pseudomonas TaxID=286 RepID=UPI0009EA4EC3|nr:MULTISPECIES: plasmid pRiA4b ORF-3 family protein [Pseudomonas]